MENKTPMIIYPTINPISSITGQVLKQIQILTNKVYRLKLGFTHASAKFSKLKILHLLRRDRKYFFFKLIQKTCSLIGQYIMSIETLLTQP